MPKQLSQKNIDLVTKVIRDARMKQTREPFDDGLADVSFSAEQLKEMEKYEAEKRAYWGQFTVEELNVLQGVYYAGRGDSTTATDIDSIIQELEIGKDVSDNKDLWHWNITACAPSALITFLSNGLEYFN